MAIEDYDKIEKPQSIKDFLVNNLLEEVDKLQGNNDFESGLRAILRSQARASKLSTLEDTKGAFFNAKNNQTYEAGLSNTNNQVVLNIAHRDEGLFSKRLPHIIDFPQDPKAAAVFTAIMTRSFESAVNSRALQIGQELVKPPSVATNINVGIEVAETEKVSVAR